MPIAISETAATAHYFLVALIIHDKYYLLGYTGTFELADLAYDIMNLALGHMVSLPGASDNCFFIGTTVAWIYCERFKLYIVSYPSHIAIYGYVAMWLEAESKLVCY